MLHRWALVLGIFVGGIAVGVAREWITKALQSFGSLLQQRLSGSRALHRRAIQKYRAEVRAELGTFRPAFDRNMRLSTRDIYVPLRIASAGNQHLGMETFDRSMLGSPAADAAEAYQAIRRAGRAVVIGPPGCGKSMLLRHSVLLWASARRRRVVGGAVESDQTAVPVLVELHRARSEEDSLRELIVDSLNGRGFHDAARFADRAIADGRLELLLDGLDEVGAQHREVIVRQIEQFADAHRACRIIVTCRSEVYRGELAGMFPDVFRIDDFDDRLIRRFLLAWPDLPDRAAVDALMAVLREAPRIRVLAGNPLLLTMIAYLFGRSYGGHNQILPHSRAEFYDLVVDTMLETLRLRQNRFPAWVKLRVLTNLALIGMDAGTNDDRRELPRAAVRTLLDRLGPDLDLPAGVDIWAVVDELVDLSGLLLRIDGGERFGFAHLTLQEYLAAVELRGNPNGLIERLRREPAIWREVAKLWCGSTTSDATMFLRQLRTIDPILALECLADVRTVETSLADELIEEHQEVFTSAAGPGHYRHAQSDIQTFAVINAFAMIAADRRQRGADVFAWLTSFLDEGWSGAWRPVLALSRTNTPKAAAALGRVLHLIPFSANALISMGDLAVPVFATLAVEPVRGDAHLDAVNYLGQIGTPEAALALVPLLWCSSREIQNAAAWQLASLVQSPDIEEALSDAKVEEVNPHSHSSEWVWEPFSSHSSPIFKVMGRVAWIIARGPMVNRPGTPNSVDPRIGLPVALSRRANDLDFGLYAQQSQISALAEMVYRQRRSLTDLDWRPVGSGRMSMDYIARMLGTRYNVPELDSAAEAIVDRVVEDRRRDSIGHQIVARLDSNSRRTVAALRLSHTVITPRSWRGIAASRAIERRVYQSMRWVLSFGVGIVTLLSVCIDNRLPLLLRVSAPIAFAGSILIACIVLRREYAVDSTIPELSTGISLLNGTLFFTALVSLIFMINGPASLLIVVLGALAFGVIGISTFVALERFRAPKNPVRDAIVRSQIDLGMESSILS